MLTYDLLRPDPSLTRSGSGRVLGEDGPQYGVGVGQVNQDVSAAASWRALMSRAPSP